MQKSAEQGQAIVLFALMMVVVTGMVALAVDLGQVYVTHQKLQNSADVAALVGVAKLPGDTAGAISAAQSSVATNSPGATVQVNTPVSGYTGTDPYIEVIVTQNVTHLYAVLFGRSSSTVRASGVATRRPSSGQGYAIVTLSTGPYALQAAGGGQGLVTNGGVWSNGGVCSGNTSSLTLQNGVVASVNGVQTSSPCVAANVSSTGSLQAPGAIADPLGSTPAPSPCPCVPSYNPPGGWDSFPAGSSSGWTTVGPGFYSDITVTSGRKFAFLPGVYFVQGDVLLQGQVVGVGSPSEDPEAAFALNEPNSDHPWGGVTFYLIDDRAQFDVRASAAVKLAPYHENTIVWMADGSHTPGGITLNGGGNSRLFGTVYAAKAPVTLAGSYGSSSSLVEGQVVGYTVTTTGSSAVTVNYNKDHATEWLNTGILVR